MRKWTQEYKQFLESLLPGAEDGKAKNAGGKAAPKKGPKGGGVNGGADKEKTSTRHIKDFTENHTDTT